MIANGFPDLVLPGAGRDRPQVTLQLTDALEQKIEAPDVCGRPSVGLVILDMDQPDLTLRCLRSVEAGGVLPARIVLVENGRERLDLTSLSDGLRSRISVLTPGVNLGCAGGRNLGLNYLDENTSTDRYVVLDNDTIVPPDFVASVEALVIPPLGVRAPVIESHPSGEVWSAGGFVRPGGRIVLANHRDHLVDDGVEVDWVPGACIVFDAPTWQQVGEFDNWMGFLFEDVDWCVRVPQLGGSIRVVSDITLLHEEHQSMGGPKSVRRAYHWSRNGTVLRRGALALGRVAVLRWSAAQLRLCWRELRAGKSTVALGRLVGLVHGHIESTRRAIGSRRPGSTPEIATILPVV